VFDYDAELSRYHVRLMAAADVGPADRVLDIGCGTGQTTRDAARSATSGHALGVDVAGAMLDRARRLTESAGLSNVSFELADAQVHPFAPGDLTLAISRFGTMFFTNPVAAFTNIGRALAPRSRLVQLVWQAYDHQEWSRAIRRALAGPDSDVEPVGPTRAAFSLADPTTAVGVLTAAGFTEVETTDVREPVYYGADAASAFDALSELQMTEHLPRRPGRRSTSTCSRAPAEPPRRARHEGGCVVRLPGLAGLCGPAMTTGVAPESRGRMRPSPSPGCGGFETVAERPPQPPRRALPGVRGLRGVGRR
jgi:SAM-dependent methyltransferase